MPRHTDRHRAETHRSACSGGIGAVAGRLVGSRVERRRRDRDVRAARLRCLRCGSAWRPARGQRCPRRSRRRWPCARRARCRAPCDSRCHARGGLARSASRRSPEERAGQRSPSPRRSRCGRRRLPRQARRRCPPPRTSGRAHGEAVPSSSRRPGLRRAPPPAARADDAPRRARRRFGRAGGASPTTSARTARPARDSRRRFRPPPPRPDRARGDGPEHRLSLDANQAWNVGEAIARVQGSRSSTRGGSRNRRVRTMSSPTRAFGARLRRFVSRPASTSRTA